MTLEKQDKTRNVGTTHHEGIGPGAVGAEGVLRTSCDKVVCRRTRRPPRLDVPITHSRPSFLHRTQGGLPSLFGSQRVLMFGSVDEIERRCLSRGMDSEILTYLASTCFCGLCKQDTLCWCVCDQILACLSPQYRDCQALLLLRP